MRARSLTGLLLGTALVAILGCARATSETPPPMASPMAPSPSAGEPTTYTLSGVSLPNGSKVNLVIGDSRIVEIGEGTQGEEIGASGLTVVPGFIDAHVHLGFYKPAEVLAGGLTSVRDLGWDPDEAFAWKAQSGKAPAWGPHTLVVGNMLTAAGGYPFQASWAPSTTAAVGTPEKVDELADRGADFIKVTLQPGAPTLDKASLKAVVAQAHKRGLKVTAHVAGLPELDKALDCGVDELAHMVFDSSSIPDTTIARMVKRGVVVIPTLRVNPSQERLDNLGRFARAGGRVVFGTDMGNGGGPGIDVEELQLMTKAGMPAAKVLGSATEVSADWLAMPERGRVEKGAIADLLLLRGDPLKDWSVLADPVMVIHEGRIVARKSGY